MFRWTVLLLLCFGCLACEGDDGDGGVGGDIVSDLQLEGVSDLGAETNADSEEVSDLVAEAEVEEVGEATEETDDPCENLSCSMECVPGEPVCGDFQACVETEAGCCSACLPIPCDAETTCPACSACDGDPGQCAPIPCAVQCSDDDDCAPGAHCEQNPEGCCGHCVEAPPDCSAHECLATCVSDADCPEDAVCAVYAEGCCSACVATPSCGEACALSEATYCADDPDDPDDPADDACVIADIAVRSLSETAPCLFELIATGPDGVEDRFLADGCEAFNTNLDENACGIEFDPVSGDLLVACNWCGQFHYHPDHCACVPDCAGKDCGPDGCGGSCGHCEAGCSCDSSGICLGCGYPEIEMTPRCVHVPTLVPAGSVIPVAIYGEAGCDSFDHVLVEQDGNAFAITVMGTSSLLGVCEAYETCPLEQWTYAGLVQLEAPSPGSYTVTVAGGPPHTVLPSGGDPPGLACPPACAEPVLEDWDWTFQRVSSDPVSGGCFSDASPGYLGTPLAFEGSCQTYSVDATNWAWATEVVACTNGHLSFGTEVPYWTEATVCDGNPAEQPPRKIMLGVTQGAAAGVDTPAMFLIDGVEAVTGATR